VCQAVTLLLSDWKREVIVAAAGGKAEKSVARAATLNPFAYDLRMRVRELTI
jgi:hypothetical protein